MLHLAILLLALAYKIKYVLQNKRTFKGWLREKCALIPETPESSLSAAGASSASLEQMRYTAHYFWRIAT